MSIQILNDFIKSKGMQLIPDKKIVNTKLTFILNDQMAHYVKAKESGSFLDFLFNNAMSKNSNDIGKVSDFFSRISNTLEQSSANLYEFKTFLYLICTLEQSREKITDYLDIRTVLLNLKDEEPSPQTGTSLIFLRNTEIGLFLELFGMERETLEDFLDMEGLDFDLQSVSLDVLIFLCLIQTIQFSQFKLSVSVADKTKQILRKNKLRRTLLKVKFIAALLVALRKHQEAKKVDQYTEILQHMKQNLKDNSHEAASQAHSNFQQSFFGLHSDINIGKLESIASNFKSITESEIESFHNFLYNTVVFQQDPEEKFKHFIQFLHLKQLSDALKMSQQLEKYKTGEHITNEQSQFIKLLKKEFYLYGMFKQAAIDYFADEYHSTPEKIFAEKFIKNEKMDKEIITFIKRSEMNLNLQLNELLQNRENEIEEVFAKIKMLPLVDEIVNILKINIDNITEETKIADLIPQMRASMRGSRMSLNTSKVSPNDYLANLQNGFERKKVQVCDKCQAICRLNKDNEEISDNLTDSQLKEKMLYDDYLQSKSILDYVHSHKLYLDDKTESIVIPNYFAFDLNSVNQTNNTNSNEIKESKIDKNTSQTHSTNVKHVKFNNEDQPLSIKKQPRKFTGMPKAPLIDLHSVSQEESEEELIDSNINVNSMIKGISDNVLPAPKLNISSTLASSNKMLNAPSNITVKRQSEITDLSAPKLNGKIKVNGDEQPLKPPTISLPNSFNNSDQLNPPKLNDLKFKTDDKTIPSAPIISNAKLQKNFNALVEAPEINFKKIQNQNSLSLNPPTIDTAILDYNSSSNELKAPIISPNLKFDKKVNSVLPCPNVIMSRSSIISNQELLAPPIIEINKGSNSNEVPEAPKINLNTNAFTKKANPNIAPIIDIKISNSMNVEAFNNLPIIKIPKQTFSNTQIPVPPVILLKLNKNQNVLNSAEEPPQLDLSFLRRNSNLPPMNNPNIEIKGYNHKRFSVNNDLFAPIFKGAKSNITDEFIPIAPVIDISFKNNKSSQNADKSLKINNGLNKDNRNELAPPSIDFKYKEYNKKDKNGIAPPDLKWQSNIHKRKEIDLAPVINNPIAVKQAVQPILSIPNINFKKNKMSEMILEAPIIDFKPTTAKNLQPTPVAPIIDQTKIFNRINKSYKGNKGNNTDILIAPKINPNLPISTHTAEAPKLNINIKTKGTEFLNAPDISINKKLPSQISDSLIAPSIDLPRRLTQTQFYNSVQSSSVNEKTNRDVPVAPVINTTKEMSQINSKILNPPIINFNSTIKSEKILAQPKQAIEIKIKPSSNLLEPPTFQMRSSLSLQKAPILEAPHIELLQMKGYASKVEISLPPSEDDDDNHPRTFSIDYPVEKPKEDINNNSKNFNVLENGQSMNNLMQMAFKKSKAQLNQINLVADENFDEEYISLNSNLRNDVRMSQTESMKQKLINRSSQNFNKPLNPYLNEKHNYNKIDIGQALLEEEEIDDFQESDTHKIIQEFNDSNPRTMSIDYPILKIEGQIYNRISTNNINQLYDDAEIIEPPCSTEIEMFKRRTTNFFEQNKINHSYINQLLTETDQQFNIEFPIVDEEVEYPRTSSAYLPLTYIEKDDEFTIDDNKPLIPKAPKMLLKNHASKNINDLPPPPTIKIKNSQNKDETLVAPYLIGKFIDKKPQNKDLAPPKLILKKQNDISKVPEAPRISLTSSAFQFDEKSDSLIAPLPNISSLSKIRKNLATNLVAPNINFNKQTNSLLEAPNNIDMTKKSVQNQHQELNAPNINFRPSKVEFSQESNILHKYNTNSNINRNAPVIDTVALHFKYGKSDMPPPKIHKSFAKNIYGELDPPTITLNSNKYNTKTDLIAPILENLKLKTEYESLQNPPMINYSLTYNLSKQNDSSNSEEINCRPTSTTEKYTLKVPTMALPTTRRAAATLSAPLNIILPVKRYHEDPLAPPDIKLNKQFFKRIEQVVEPPKLAFQKKNQKNANFSILIEEMNENNSTIKNIYSGKDIPQAPKIDWNPSKNRKFDGLNPPKLDFQTMYLGKNLDVPKYQNDRKSSGLMNFNSVPSKLLEAPIIDLKNINRPEPRFSTRTLEILGFDNKYSRNQTVIEYMKFPIRNPTNYERISVCENLLTDTGIKALPKSDPVSIHSSLIFENTSKSSNRLPLMPPVLLSSFSKSMILTEMANKNMNKLPKNNLNTIDKKEGNSLPENENSLMMFINLANLNSKCKTGSQNSSRSSEIYVKLPPIAVSDGRKMHTLFWEKIQPNQLVSTIWIQVYNNYVGIMLNNLLEFFEDAPQSIKSHKSIDLIFEEGRKKTIAFTMAKLFKLKDFSWHKLSKILWEVSHEEIGLETMLNFRKILPNKLEIEQIKELKQEDLVCLESPSMWLVVAASVPRLIERLNFLELQNRIENELKDKTQYVKNFISVCEFFQSNKNFQKFLRICIDAGNVLNTEKNQGAALGFKITSLLQFFHCTSTVRNGLSLMEYILFECYIQDPNSFNFVNEITSKIAFIISRNLEDLVEDLISIKKQFYLLKVELETAENDPQYKDSYFLNRFQKFFVQNAENVVLLEEEAIRLKEFYHETMIFLGETEKSLSRKKSKEVMSSIACSFHKMHEIVSKFK